MSPNHWNGSVVQELCHVCGGAAPGQGTSAASVPLHEKDLSCSRRALLAIRLVISRAGRPFPPQRAQNARRGPRWLARKTVVEMLSYVVQVQLIPSTKT